MMYQKSRFPESGFINVLLTLTLSICSVTCLNSLYCDVRVSGGYVDQSCSRLLGTRCKYYCDSGLVKTRDMVNCGIDGKWYPDKTPHCIIPDLCPSTFNDGYISPLCSRRIGAWCEYYCNQGFFGTSRVLTCGIYGNWIPYTNTACLKSDPCPAVFNGGSIEPSCSRFPGDSCTFTCNPEYVKNGNRLTCGEDGKWIQDISSVCIKSVDKTSSRRISSPVSGGVIAGITTSVVIVILIIPAIVILKLKRSRVRKSTRNATAHSGSMFWRPRENPLQNTTSTREHNHEDGIGSTLSFESPSYDGLYTQSFVQRMPAISSSCTYPEPPPSYRETQYSTNESPPTYNDVVTDPTRFSLHV